MDGNFDDVSINTFKNSLSAEHDLRKSLTGKPATNIRQLMDQIDKYKRVEEDQLQGEGKKKEERREEKLLPPPKAFVTKCQRAKKKKSQSSDQA